MSILHASRGLGAAAALVFSMSLAARAAPLPGGTLDPATIPQFVAPLVVPPAMPKTKSSAHLDEYEIAVRQFTQQVLPPGFPSTTVWSYGAVGHPDTFNYPALTIEAEVNKRVRVKWINDLKDPISGAFLPHLIPVDQTLHWANPPQRCADGAGRTDCVGVDPTPYRGPVPIVVHRHGAHSRPESDGHPQAWWLPDATNIPPGFARHGSAFAQVAGAPVRHGEAVFEYANDQRAATLWYHDHTLGMTRANVYAGPVGFYLLRGGEGDLVMDERTSKRAARLPDRDREIPIAIQDRSFNTDGSLFYASSRRFFDDYPGPYAPETDIAPIWNPEFFGNTIVVNGRTWPYLEVEARRYRFRFLNGSQSRFLILSVGEHGPRFWQIGSDGGFLAAPVEQERLLLGPAERADVVMDFSGHTYGTSITLANLGPDEPFGGGEPGEDFAPADPDTTGRVMEFRIIAPHDQRPDRTTPPQYLELPAPAELGDVRNVRQVSLNEESSSVECLTGLGSPVACGEAAAVEPVGPARALLGTLEGGSPTPRMFEDAVTERPRLDSTELWEVFNFTEDAHPIHVHLIQFEVVNRQPLQLEDGVPVIPVAMGGPPRPPEPWESGRKDTVIVYPGEVTRVKARFDIAGEYVWHCHILEHEDNDMMRPYSVVP